MSKMRTRGGYVLDDGNFKRYHGNKPNAKGHARTSKRNLRAMYRRTRQAENSHEPTSWKRRPTKAQPSTSKRQRKLELMEQARRAGWRGKTYHSAKKFDQWLSLIGKMQAEADAEIAADAAAERIA